MPRSSTDPARGISSGSEVDCLREDCVAMLAVAAERGQVVPDELRERLSLGVRGLPATRMLVLGRDLAQLGPEVVKDAPRLRHVYLWCHCAKITPMALSGDQLPNEDEALEDARADEYEARLDELEADLPAFERRMRTIERTTAVRDEPHNGNMADMRGAYSADRAAALSGVPLSTVHWWARNDILVPSVSPVRVKLWSYADLMSLRVIHWLRREKKTDEGTTIPRTAMPAVRRALRELAALDMALWTEDGGPGISVNRAGQVFLMTGPSPERAADRQRALGSTDALDVLAPFPTESARGPNLVEPRPLLRIVPGKLGGSPHVQHTRLESRAIGALAGRGFDRSKIHRLYPEIEPAAIGEAVDLERQLARNLGRELVAA